MSLTTVLNTTRSTLIWIILFLSVICLVAESLPEVKAKIIVVPTLILMFILSILEIHNRWDAKRKLI
jgi:hypothetical protein